MLAVGQSARVFQRVFVDQDQVGVGRMDDDVVDLLEGVGLEKLRLGLGTPDLAAASELVADEHQRRAPSLGNRGAGQ